ncbi:hypothetical protein FRC17_001674 [Serendipita sp. 399]|nr:hypothetical protein FRC17_001674 [Serendipita sp. 399]
MKFTNVTLFVVLKSLILGAIATGSVNHSRIPAGAITVGNEGHYPNLTVALNDTSSNVFYIYAGNYTGQTLISRPNVTIYGETWSPYSYLGNRVTLSVNMPASQAGSNDLSGTVRIHATGVKFYNLDIENTYGQASVSILPTNILFTLTSTALASHPVSSDRAKRSSGEHKIPCLPIGVIKSTLVLGLLVPWTSWIFGMYASVWITKSVVESTGNGYLTASGRNTSDAFWYVIDESAVIGNAKNQTYLGRPWRASARVVYQKSYLGDNIKPEGWSQWQATDPRTTWILFGEYKNFGPGAWNASTRPSFATKLNASIPIDTVLGSNYTKWVDIRHL